MVKNIFKDAASSLVVFFVALPLCLGIALASGAPLISGLIAGVIGGVLVGLLSGSHTSVSGPAAGLTTVVIAQINELGAFESFLLALLIAGFLQIGLGLLKAGGLSVFFPSSVIKGLLAAIGIILILKQLPHLLGHDNDPEGEFAFVQPDHENTFSELFRLFQGEFHDGALVIGITSLIFLLVWDRVPKLKKSMVPAPVLVVILGILMAEGLRRLGSPWLVESTHLVDVPIAKNWAEFTTFFKQPDFSKVGDPRIYSAAFTIALVASLETLLNLEAVDKIDPQQRRSPPNRELISQGIGNIACGMLGGLPVTSVIVRSSVNINSGARSKLSAILHGLLLMLAVLTIPSLLNRIPLSCLAAILLVTGFKLASISLFKQMWKEGPYQYLPFLATLIAIVLTDLVVGIGFGLTISIAFILYSNMRSPVRQVLEKQIGGDVLHILLSSQVSFLKRASLEEVLYQAKPGTHILLDAEGTDFIEPDILSLFHDFRKRTAAARGVTLSTRGFAPHFGIENRIEFDEYTTQQLQQRFSPKDVLDFLKVGNERFRSNNRITRDLGHQVQGTAAGQHPLAVILTCIDSRSPAELIFDLGLGDVFTIRIAGNVVRSKVLGSMEYACAVAGAKLIVVMGHTRCGAINASVDLSESHRSALDATGCEHLDMIVQEIQKSIDHVRAQFPDGALNSNDRESLIQRTTISNIENSVRFIRSGSQKLRQMHDEGKIDIVGAIYHVETGEVEFLPVTKSS